MMVQMAGGADAILKFKQPQRPRSAGLKLRYITMQTTKICTHEDHYHNYLASMYIKEACVYAPALSVPSSAFGKHYLGTMVNIFC